MHYASRMMQTIERNALYLADDFLRIKQHTDAHIEVMKQQKEFYEIPLKEICQPRQSSYVSSYYFKERNNDN